MLICNLERISGEEECSGAHDDVWALGITLFNLVTTLAPWNCAQISDQAFRRYSKRPDEFLDNYPISTHVKEVLKRALCLVPTDRCTASELRADVEKVDIFFDESRMVYTSRSISEPYGQDSKPSESTHANAPYGRPAYSMSDPEFYLSRLASTDLAARRSLGSSSTNSSELIITPETIPRDPAVVVPDFPEDALLGLGVIDTEAPVFNPDAKICTPSRYSGDSPEDRSREETGLVEATTARFRSGQSI